jgi:hypothetical protein
VHVVIILLIDMIVFVISSHAVELMMTNLSFFFLGSMTDLTIIQQIEMHTTQAITRQ